MTLWTVARRAPLSVGTLPLTLLLTPLSKQESYTLNKALLSVTVYLKILHRVASVLQEDLEYPSYTE